MCASLGVILRERPDARTQLRSNTLCAVEAALLDPRTGATGTIVALTAAVVAAAQCLEPKSALRQFSKLVIVVGVGAFDSEQDECVLSLNAGQAKKKMMLTFTTFTCARQKLTHRTLNSMCLWD